MTVVLIVLFSVVCLGVMPFFLIEQRKKVSAKSLLLKMICASLFLAVGLFAYKSAGGSTYAKYMLLGLALSWVGDLGLHTWGKVAPVCKAVGTLSFLSAHVAYLTAYHERIQALSPDTRFFIPTMLIPILIGMAVYLLIIILTGTKLSVLMLPLSVYIFVLMLMCVKAIQLAHLSVGSSVFGAILLSIGSLFFLLSDTSLGLLMFNKKIKQSFPTKIFNIATYFVAQLMLASTILFI